MAKLSLNFTRGEFACKCGCGFDTVDAKLLQILEDVRQYFGQPVTINSGCRCKEHNAAVGGKPESQHLLGRAADIVVKDVTPAMVFDYLVLHYPSDYGFGAYGTFTHIDSRESNARWAYVL